MHSVPATLGGNGNSAFGLLVLCSSAEVAQPLPGAGTESLWTGLWKAQRRRGGSQTVVPVCLRRPVLQLASLNLRTPLFTHAEHLSEQL